jgi:ABC-type multidrug transport system permease subunit
MQTNMRENMADKLNKFKSAIEKLDDQFQSYLIFIIIGVVVIFYLFYIYEKNQQMLQINEY